MFWWQVLRKADGARARGPPRPANRESYGWLVGGRACTNNQAGRQPSRYDDADSYDVGDQDNRPHMQRWARHSGSGVTRLVDAQRAGKGVALQAVGTVTTR